MTQPRARRWYKKDVKAMLGALDHVWLVAQPLPSMMGLAAGALDEARGRFVALDRARLVIGHFANLAALFESRAKEQADAVVSFVETRAYGDSTEMMVERFEKLAAGTRKDVARLHKLIERIENEGLPAEVVEFDPTQPQAQ